MQGLLPSITIHSRINSQCPLVLRLMHIVVWHIAPRSSLMDLSGQPVESHLPNHLSCHKNNKALNVLFRYAPQNVQVFRKLVLCHAAPFSNLFSQLQWVFCGGACAAAFECPV